MQIIKFSGPSQIPGNTSNQMDIGKNLVKTADSFKSLKKAKSSEQSEKATSGLVSNWIRTSLGLIWQGIVGNSKS